MAAPQGAASYQPEVPFCPSPYIGDTSTPASGTRMPES
jgi:hypothetical protein